MIQGDADRHRAVPPRTEPSRIRPQKHAPLNAPLLAIETSCDDTCAAVVTVGGEVLSGVVSSQEIHTAFRGVVPELASREHMRLILPVIEEALERAGVKTEDLAGVAVTNGPGLIGSLLVGLSAAKGLAFARRIPLIGVNHIEAHLMAVLAKEPVPAPAVGLVVSGGHTELLEITEWGSWRVLGATRDDAAGEAFDKVAKLLDLGYPGGPAIDRVSRSGAPDAFHFPRAMMKIDQGGHEFSFSGLKTAVKVFLDSRGWPQAPAGSMERSTFVADVAASFQSAVVDVLVAKVNAAVRTTEYRRVVVCGGVACNAALRRRLEEAAAEERWELHLPPPALCCDNAVMVGLAGAHHYRRGEVSPLSLPASPNLDDWTGRYGS
ncbi:MAG: tRNA (adenosine(37)-N6)-threonylcarbamoyltransferase complex transferase subunit TsaD [Candidatus Eisenbacteria bacterium]|nr:tRNA (adenosine(37)-N6)-threonylcarbamoyltransferase complex transferase subunit TsaD [Candidatus Eisenbacteria bacterium]